ncbi:hypothetical protein J4E08_05595 [Sagittula sp. NFXS13]|uniref:hypothetical protein n=1 Tax=Sagittula sp. NFXS13 TaxID=2819095 RepID=UPI0032DEAB36
MSEFTLTKTRFVEGVWEGMLTTQNASAVPDVQVSLRDLPVAGVTVTEVAPDASNPGRHWLVSIPVPPEAVGDGVQTFLITDAGADTSLGSFTLVAGEALGDDIRAEVELLRAELDMLKRAFRRHCLETA